MDSHVTSDTMGYTLMDYALYGITKGFARTNELVQYLEKNKPSSLVPKTSQCVPFQAHVPHQTTGQLGKLYLFTAARDGHRHCVILFLETELMDPFSVSKPDGFTVLDYAEDAAEKNTPGAIDVVKYLRRAWPKISSRKRKCQRHAE